MKLQFVLQPVRLYKTPQQIEAVVVCIPLPTVIPEDGTGS